MPSSSEFDLIRRYFAGPRGARRDVLLGIGDDAAELEVPAGATLAVSADTLVAGVHFASDAQADTVGHKALAVGLSDLAAMGAEPAWAVLALTLPEADEAWLGEFCRGFFALADEYGVALVGGDTTRGPLSVTVMVHGFVPSGGGMRRGGAQPGDMVWVTGTLGDAALALRRAGHDGVGCAGPDAAWLSDRLHRPRPRVAEALRLRGVAHAAIDVSDGLRADLGHVLEASGVGATLVVDDLPLSPAFRSCSRDVERAVDLALAGGDDYELCFTMAPAARAELEHVMAATACPYTPIGTIETDPGLRLVRGTGEVYEMHSGGYDHFAIR